MKRSQLPLTALRAFEAAARHESFQGAARELSVSPSVISRHVSELEVFIGEALFFRQVRNVALTPVGNSLRLHLSAAFDEMTNGLLDIMRGAVGIPRTLNVHVPPTFAVRALLPRLPDFEQIFENVQMQLIVTTDALKRAHPATVGFDIRIGYVRERPRAAAVLFNEEGVVVAKPEYVTKFADATGNVPHGNLFMMRLVSSGKCNWDWKKLAASLGMPWPRSVDTLSVENDDLALQAAIMGAGVALVERRFIKQEIETGAVQVLPNFPAISLGFYTIEASDEQSPFFRRFAKWLREDL